MRGHYRHTKIIATVGPATESKEKLTQLITAGVDVIRLNMAHGTGEWVTSLVKRIREVSQRSPSPCRGHDGCERPGDSHRRGGRADRTQDGRDVRVLHRQAHPMAFAASTSIIPACPPT